MKSFPSSSLKAGQSVDTYATSKSITQTLIESFNNAMNSSQESKNVFDGMDLGINYNNGLASDTKKILLDNVSKPVNSGASPYNTRYKLERSNKNSVVENPLKFSSEVLNAINKYRFTFKNTVTSRSIMYKVHDEGDQKGDNKLHVHYSETVSSPSLFNPWYAVSTKGFSAAIPLITNANTEIITAYYESPDVDSSNIQTGSETTNTQKTSTQKDDEDLYNVLDVSKHTKDNVKYQNVQVNIAPGASNKDISDCSIDTLVKLSEGKSTSTSSNVSELGVAKYRYIDFMFCRDLGKIPNNHLLTLRKFTRPVGDNITTRYPKSKTPYNFNQSMDVGRLITWFGNGDNKLEDIIKYNYVATFKKFESKIQEVDSREEDNSTGIIGKLVNSFNPAYNNALNNGLTSNHNILQTATRKTGIGQWLNKYEIDLNSTGNSDHMRELQGKYDSNKIYEPKNTIQETHQYEGKLQFSQEFTLKFSYKLRAYDNINPRAAFLDLIGNILAVTYRNGTFWGGSRMFKGAPPNKTGWAKANSFINRTFNTLGGIGNSLLSGNLDIGGTLGSIWGAIKEIAGSIGTAAQGVVNDLTGNSGKQTKEKAKTGLSKVKELIQKSGLWAGIQGMIKNGLGRPAVYALDSLLTGDNVGLWHLTIGNPRNPIMSIGNLIIDKSEIIQSGPLGLDDFPTDLTVTVTLKHGRPRDSSEIQKMYTKGLTPIYSPLGVKAATKFYNLGSNNISERYVADIPKTTTNKDNSSSTTHASTNPNAVKLQNINTETKVKITNTSTDSNATEETLTSTTNNMTDTINDNITSWIYAELGDYQDEIIQTSIELSEPSGESPIKDEDIKQGSANTQKPKTT